MTKRKHTPAPWDYEYQPYRAQDGHEIPNFEITGNEDDPECAKICDTNENAPADVQVANAQLIASAPELLQALKNCVEVWDDLYGNMCDEDGDEQEIAAFENAKAIINTATKG